MAVSIWILPMRLTPSNGEIILDIQNYIRRIIRDYLRNRTIVYNVGNHIPLAKCTIEKGVPQGSVLGLLLWNGIRPGSKSGGLRRKSRRMRTTL